MKYKYLLLVLANFILFLSIFHLFQNEKIYKATMGKISMNYERTGDWNNYRVDQVRKPYVAITNENLQHWDADIYKCIKEKMYSPEEGCYNGVRGAFFPLFPAVWKALSVSTIGICVVNYFLFSLALILLIELLAKDETPRSKIMLLIICLSVPSLIIFYIPYTESVFMIATTIAVWGFIKRNYMLYFTGGFLIAATRPASLFICLAILSIEVLFFMLHFDWKKLFRDSLLKIAPLVVGYFSVICFQYFYWKSWTVLIDARKAWPEESLGMRIPEMIRDWSLEGFGMSVFSIFFVCIPSIIYLFYTLWKILIHKNKTQIQAWFQQESNYLSMVSMAYLGLFLVYTFFYRGGSLNSFSRYTLSSPFFFLLIILNFKQIRSVPFKKLLALFIISIAALVFFLWLTAYFGGGKFRFEYAGMHFGILLYGFYLFHQFLRRDLATLLLMGLYGLNLLWTAYLFNSFLSNGWIFT